MPHELHEEVPGVIPAAADTHRPHPQSTWWNAVFHYTPALLWILLLYVLGAVILGDQRAELFSIRGYGVTWATLIVFVASLVCMVEILQISRPGVDNAIEVYLMLVLATAQAVAIALSVAYPEILWFMRTPENIMLMAMNAVQGFVAQRVNARSLIRTITGSPVTG